MKTIFLTAGTSALLFAGAVAQADPAQDILGHWTTGFMTEDQGINQSRQSYQFDATTFHVDIDFIANHPMSTQGLRVTFQGTYVIGGPSTIPGAYNTDITFTAGLLTALHPNTVKYYNDKHQCGLDDWQIGVPRDVTGRTCENVDSLASLVGTLYTVIKIVPNEFFQMGDIPDGSTVGSDAAHRPTTLSRDMVPRNGMGGTTEPDPVDALLPGIYAVTSFKVNHGSCDLAAAQSANPFSHFELFANAAVIPQMKGWTFESCSSRQSCVDQVNKIGLLTDFPLFESVGVGRYTGKIVETTWHDTCQAVVRLNLTERDASTGQLTFVSKVLRGQVEGVSTGDECRAEVPQIDQQLATFDCTEVAEMTASPDLQTRPDPH